MKIESGIKERPEFMVVYGGPGLGKSTLASGMPKTIFANIEDRLSHLDVQSVRIKTWDELLAFLNDPQLKDFGSIAIDTMDAAELLLKTKIMEKYGKTEWSQISDHGKNYDMITDGFRVLMDKLTELRNSGKNVCLVCHSEVKTVNDPMTLPYDRHQPKIYQKAMALIRERVDNLFFVSKDITSKEKRAFTDDRRYVFTEWSPSYDAKCSFNLPASFELRKAGGFDHYLELKGTKKGDTIASIVKQLEGWVQAFDTETQQTVNEKIAEFTKTNDLPGLVRLRNKIKENIK